eukprot:718860-Hanusia_phi.AAC.4
MGQACSACEPRRVEDNFQEKKRSRLMAIPEKPPLKALQGFHSQADVERRERDISCKTPRMQLPDQSMGSEEIYVPRLKHRPDSAGGPPLESPRKESSLENGNIMIAPLDFIVTTMKGVRIDDRTARTHGQHACSLSFLPVLAPCPCSLSSLPALAP